MLLTRCYARLDYKGVNELMTHALTESQLNNIAGQLESQRRELLEQIRQQIRESGQAERLDRYTQLKDPGDYSVADLMGDLELDQIDRETEQLRDIEDAELRIQKGTYGECQDCGIEIKKERLFAQPTASRCTQCQEIYERTHANRMNHNM